MAQTDSGIYAEDDTSLKSLIIKLSRWYKYLRLKWVTLLIAGIVGGALALTAAFIKKPVYKAELNFALQDDDNSGGLGAAAGLASQFGIDLGGGTGLDAFSGDNVLELLKSRAMVEHTLLTPVTIDGKKQTLAHVYITFNNYKDKWEDDPQMKDVDYLPGANRSKFSLKQDSMLGVFYRNILKKNLSVDRVDKKLSIISVKVESKDELFSKYVAEILVKTVADFYIDTKTKKSAQNVIILQRLTDSVRRELNSAITGVASSSDVNPNANPALQILRVPSQHHQVDVEANGAMLTELVKNLELAKISLRKETPLIQIIDNPILPLEVERWSKIISIIVGGFLGVFFTSIYLISRLLYKSVLAS